VLFYSFSCNSFATTSSQFPAAKCSGGSRPPSFTTVAAPVYNSNITNDSFQLCYLLSNCSGSSWRSGAQVPYRSRLGWSAGAFRHMLSSHTGSFLLYLVWELRSPPFYLIKSLCNCTSAAPMSSVPSVKRSTATKPKMGLKYISRSPGASQFDQFEGSLPLF